MTHRRTPSRPTLVLPGWFFVVSGVVTLAALVWLALIAVDDLRSDDDTSATPASTSAPSPSPSATTASPTPTRTTARPTPSRTTPSPTPDVDRSSIAVDVLNGTRTPGLARQSSGSVQRTGWTVGAVGNWRGAVAATTVYYPAGREAEAKQLAKDIGVQTTAPAVAGMRTDRLTVVLLSVR